MSWLSRFMTVALAASALTMLPGIADAQRRPPPRHPPHHAPTLVLRGQVFIGGYFYDPFFGPYPWWPRTAYPYWYQPIYDNRADVRLRVEPKEAEEAAVYVDGFYAGIVDDFNGIFQSLPLTPGGHTLVLFLDGYQTVQRNVYLSPGSSFTLRATMERLPAGVASELPELAPPVPVPPAGTYQMPVTPPRAVASAPARPTEATGSGTLDIFVQPPTAEVTIDGQRWLTNEEGHFLIQVTAGKHHVEVGRPGYRPFATDVEVGQGLTVPLAVSLVPTSS